MANQKQQLTVVDLEAAKDCVRSAQDIAMSIGDRRNYELYGVAAFCIGIVEEMVKLDTKGVEYIPWHDQIDLEDEHALVDGAAGEVMVDDRHWQNIRFIAELTQVHHKSVAAFGWEVKKRVGDEK